MGEKYTGPERRANYRERRVLYAASLFSLFLIMATLAVGIITTNRRADEAATRQRAAITEARLAALCLLDQQATHWQITDTVNRAAAARLGVPYPDVPAPPTIADERLHEACNRFLRGAGLNGSGGK